MPTNIQAQGIDFGPVPDGGGLGEMFAPENLAKIQAYKQATAFQNGLPLDPATGTPDFGAAGAKLFQLGDYANGAGLLDTALKQQGMSLAVRNAASVGQWGGGAPAPTSVAPAAYNGATPPSTTGANPDVVNGIRTVFAAKGINPNVALAAFGAEGLRGFDPAGNANPGDNGSSFGPFQLHYGGVAGGANAVAGLGDDFTKATGLDARDPKTWRQQLDFVADHVAKNGWGAWNGAKRIGITGMMGIGAPPAPAPVAGVAPDGTAAPANAAPLPPRRPTQVAQNGADDANPSGRTPSDQHPYASAAPAYKPLPSSGGAPSWNGAPTASPSSAPSNGAPPPAPVRVAGPGAPPAPRQAPMPTIPTTPPPLSAAVSSAPQPLDPSFGGQVPDAWLKAGHSAGEWVNYARKQAAMNGAIPGGYGKGASDQWAKIADGLASSIDKSQVFTPEQKNARDPQALAYEHQKVDYANQSRVQSDYSTEAIRGAGQKAAAEAQGRAESTNANTLVPYAQPDGTMRMMTKAQALDMAGNGPGQGPVKSLPGYITTGQDNLLAKVNDGTKAYQERQVAGERLDALSNLLSTYQTGANSQAFNDAVAKVRSFGFDIKDTDTINPAAVQQFAKNSYANVLSTMREQGNKQFVAEVNSAVNSNPNTDLQPAANAAMIAQMKGIQAYHDANQRDFVNWYGSNQGASHDAQFQIGWAKEHPVQPFVDAARKEIAPMGVAIPKTAERTVGQRYVIPGKGVYRWMGKGWAAN